MLQVKEVNAMSEVAKYLPKRTAESDGTPLDVFSLPTDSASLEELLRDLFENHWQEITFGILIQGAAWEMKTDKPPTRIGMLDGYLTVAFGVPHFHVCIGEPRAHATVRRHRNWRDTDARRGPRSIGGSAVPACRCPGAYNSSMAPTSSRSQCCYPIRSCIRRPTGFSRSPTGRASPFGTSFGRDGSASPNPTQSTDRPAAARRRERFTPAKGDSLESLPPRGGN